MKLSKKGLERLSEPILKFVDGYYDYAIVETLEDHEFKPEDFQGAVVLTVEEAEILTRCAANEFCRLILEHAPVDLARQVEVLMYDLVKRIEQAEKGNETK